MSRSGYGVEPASFCLSAERLTTRPSRLTESQTCGLLLTSRAPYHQAKPAYRRVEPASFRFTSRAPYHQAKPAHRRVEPASFRFQNRAPYHQAKPAHRRVEPVSFRFTSRAPYTTKPSRLTGDSNLRPSALPAERLDHQANPAHRRVASNLRPSALPAERLNHQAKPAHSFRSPPASGFAGSLSPSQVRPLPAVTAPDGVPLPQQAPSVRCL